MLDAIPPVVHVVTSGGVDWPAVVAPLAAAAAGAVGVFATARQARQDRAAQGADVERSREAQSKDLRLSIDAAAENLRLSITAENERARLADKRRIYAACQASFSTMSSAATYQRVNYPASDKPVNKARNVMHEAVSELQLIAPEEVADLTTEIVMAFLGFVIETHSGVSQEYAGIADIGRLRLRLYQAMRADLGEPVPESVSQPDQPAGPVPGDG